MLLQVSPKVVPGNTIYPMLVVPRVKSTNKTNQLNFSVLYLQVKKQINLYYSPEVG